MLGSRVLAVAVALRVRTTGTDFEDLTVRAQPSALQTALAQPWVVKLK